MNKSQVFSGLKYLDLHLVMNGFLSTPWTQDVNWTLIRFSEDIFRIYHVHSVFVLYSWGKYSSPNVFFFIIQLNLPIADIPNSGHATPNVTIFWNYLPIADTSWQRANFLRPVGVLYSEISLYTNLSKLIFVPPEIIFWWFRGDESWLICWKLLSIGNEIYSDDITRYILVLFSRTRVA